MDRTESIVEGEALPRPIGGEAIAELIKPRPHNPPAATYINRLFPSWFMWQLNHKGVSRSGRYRTDARAGGAQHAVDTLHREIQLMESTTDLPGDPAQSAAGRLKSDLVHGAKDLKDTAGAEIRNLMADVEDLMTRVAGVKDPDIRLVRSRVLKTLDAARTSMSAGAGRAREHAIKAAGTTNDFVRENPWQSLGIAVLLGAAVGYLARRRSSDVHGRTREEAPAG
jgi:ElaB/YqjD/DUF883 family membrane-anchored ribosome-binding protein